MMDIKDLKDKLSENLDSDSVDFLLSQIYGKKKIGKKIDVKKIYEEIQEKNLFNLS